MTTQTPRPTQGGSYLLEDGKLVERFRTEPLPIAQVDPPDALEEAEPPDPED